MTITSKSLVVSTASRYCTSRRLLLLIDDEFAKKCAGKLDFCIRECGNNQRNCLVYIAYSLSAHKKKFRKSRERINGRKCDKSHRHFRLA